MLCPIISFQAILSIYDILGYAELCYDILGSVILCSVVLFYGLALQKMRNSVCNSDVLRMSLVFLHSPLSAFVEVVFSVTEYQSSEE